jgi:hypothetical protein
MNDARRSIIGWGGKRNFADLKNILTFALFFKTLNNLLIL